MSQTIIFSGSIPPLVITSLINLESLSLSDNHFEGSFSFSSFANHSKLQVFKLNPLGSELYVKTEGMAFSPPFQLRVLYLARCNLNNETPEVPNFLSYQKELRALDLSSNNLVGKFPNCLLQKNTHLEFLSLRNNSFTGPFQLDSPPKLHLQVLDISNNDFGGQLPQDLGLFFPIMLYLNFSRNYFEGNIPESLGNLTKAYAIDLSHNNFSGEVPNRIGTGCLQLRTLMLSNNNLRGSFPSNSMNLATLELLYVDNNYFAGSISHGLSRSPHLIYLDISNNKFQGKIPSWIGNFSNLITLDLSQNLLEGTIPDDICKLENLSFLALSENRLNGTIPSCSSLSSLNFIHLQRNQLTGSIPNALLESSQLLTLDLRHNNLAGGIPHDIGILAHLRVFLLGGNNLQGQIPLSVCQLMELSIMDLSHNHFSGRIPSCLRNISFGRAHFAYDKWNEIIRDYTYLATYNISLSLVQDAVGPFIFQMQEVVEFTTKSLSNAYAGYLLNYMSGLDLSCNQLTGEIPPELGDLSEIRALNLSHSHLQGSIPSELSSLNLIESLDFSYNDLSGQIPYQLTNLHFLSVFNVSYNNLSGKTPDKGQFANFDESNYRENPSLCGPLLERNCKSIIVDPLHAVGGEENDGEIDMVAFIWSFFASFVAVLATLALTLYLNPQYCRLWSSFIDTWTLSRIYQRYKSRSQKLWQC